jgi:hypothetical protein
MIAMILLFLNIRHSGTLKAKYVELMGKEKGYKSSYVYYQAKGWSKKS